MKDYNKMSDFDINEAAAKALGLELSSGNDGSYVGIVRRRHGCLPSYIHVNYCNNPSDAWPIMKESLIGVTPDEDGVTMHFYGDWTARAHCKNLQFTDKNPLRAAMIVYLMMKDEEK